MAELSDLREALRDVTEHAERPAFESLVRRARDRRRRRHVSIVAAAALVLTGTAAVLVPDGRTSSAPSPVDRTGPATPSVTSSPHPSPTTALGRLRAMSTGALVARGRLVSAGSIGGGTVMTVWSVCVDDSLHCRYAWRLADRSGAVTEGPAGAGDGSSGPVVHAGGGAFVLKAWDRPGFAVDAEGTVTPLVRGRVDPVNEGAVVVRSGARHMELVDPRTAETQPLPDVPGSDALDDAEVAADGTVWAMPAFAGPGKVEVAWLRGGVWHSHPIHDPAGSRTAVPGALAVAGTRMTPTRVAALSSYDGATVAPVGVLAVSVDGGATWAHLTRKDVPFGTVDSMAATAGGTLFVTEADGTLWRSSSATWTGFVRVPGVGPVGLLEPAGEQVLAEAATRDPRLVLVADDGSTEPVRAR